MTWCFRAIKPDKEFIEYCRNHLLDKQKAKNPELEKIIDDIGEQIKSLKHEVGNLGYKIKNQRQEINNLLKENTKLKELLKLAKSSVSYHCALCREYTDGQILLLKINQVLGKTNIEKLFEVKPEKVFDDEEYYKGMFETENKE